MDTTTFQAIKDLLSKHDQIGIAVGKNQTLDEMGAALSLYLILAQMGKKISVASPVDPIVEISSLVGIDKVKKSLGGADGDLIVSFPYKDDEIQKVSYTLENGFLNIIVKAAEQGLSFNEKEVQYKRGGGVPSLLFIIGTPRLSDLGDLFNPEALKDTTVVNIDNKNHNQGFGDVVVVSPKYSSVSEEMADLFQFLEIDVDLDIAQNLLSGISFATNNFQDQKTSFMAFEMAARLMKKGAVRHNKKQQNDSYFTPFKQSGFADQQTRQQRPRGEMQNRFQQKPSQQTQFPPYQQQTNKQQEKIPSSSGGKQDDQDAPSDWLTPKVYKGSTLV